jgi:hypothetical protein
MSHAYPRPTADQIRALQPGWRLHLHRTRGYGYVEMARGFDEWIPVQPPPPGWFVHPSTRYSRHYYYYHPETQTSVWDPPTAEQRERASSATETEEATNRRRLRMRMRRNRPHVPDDVIVARWIKEEERKCRDREAAEMQPHDDRLLEERRSAALLPPRRTPADAAASPSALRRPHAQEETRTLYRTPTGGCTYDRDAYQEAMREYQR